MPSPAASTLQQAYGAYEAYDYERACALAQTAAAQLHAAGDRLERAQALLLAARAAYHAGQVLTAQEHYEHAAELCHELGERHALLECRLGLAKCAARRGELSQAQHIAQAVLKEARAKQYLDLEAQALAALGNAAWKQGDAVSAAARLQQAVELFSRLRLKPEAHYARGSLAVALAMGGRAEESAACSKRALAYFRQVGDTRSVAKILSNLGLVAYSHGEFEMARSYLRRLMQLEEALQDPTIMAITAYNLGLLELQEGRYNMARKPLTRAYHLAQNVGDRVVEGAALMYLAVLAVHEGLPEEALNYMELSERRLTGLGADEELLLRHYLPVVLLAGGLVERATARWRKKPAPPDYTPYLDDLSNLYRLLEFLVRSGPRQGVTLEPAARAWAKRWRDEVSALIANCSPG